MEKRPLLTTIILFLTLTGAAATVFAASVDQQRSLFLEAEKALQRGELQTFDTLRARLRDYPLYPYLEYQALRGRLDQASAQEVTAFLERYRQTPLAWLLRANWLDRLASRQHWSAYLTFYRPSSNVSRRCHQLQALIATGRADEAMPKVEALWLHGRSRPRACDPVFDAWTSAGHLTDDLRWRRIEKAMEAGEWRLARYLGRGLPNADRVWLKRWIRLYKAPRRLAAETERYSDPHPYREVMLAHSIRRLARWDGEEAMHLWQQIKPQFAFDHDQILRTEQYIVRNLVRIPGDDVYAFIRSVEVGRQDIKVHDARIGAALLREDWPQVIRWIGALPREERDSERWSYWLGRALAGIGETEAASRLFAKVARERTYYGFLAADRVGSEYHLAHIDTPVSEALVTEIASTDAARRAAELFALERWTDARREWRIITRDMTPDQLKAAAILAKRNGWHDRAIFTLARTGYWDDLELRFPLEHAELVENNAKRHDIDIAWVFAVMRQESAFMANARSHAGAMGLMQLMPATARNVARKMLKQRPPRRYELYRPETNIALGSAYLKQIKDELGDSAVLATAAYNAGPHRVARWLPERTLPADIWIELVPFSETRGYLRRVLAYTVIYEKRMGLEPTRLHDRLHPVPPNINLIGDTHAAAAIESAG